MLTPKGQETQTFREEVVLVDVLARRNCCFFEIDTYNYIIVRIAMCFVVFLWISALTSFVESNFTTSGLIDEASRAASISMFQCNHNESITRELY